MRITFALPALNLSGGTRVVFDYARHLIARGHEVTVVVPSPKTPTLKQRAKAFLKIEAIEREPNERTTHFSRTSVPISRGRGSKNLTEGDFPDADLVIATWWETGEWIANLPRLKGKKLHFVQDHEIFRYLPLERVRAVYSQHWPKITVSNWLTEICISNYRSESVYCVPNGVGLSQFKGKLRGKGEAPIIGMLWSNSERKNSQMGLEAILKIKELIPNLRVILFGSSQRPANIIGAEWIDYHWRPEQSKIPELYAGCNAWLFSSRSEGFGLPILEAMAMHTPVVATSAGAAPDLINGRNGLIVGCTAPEMAAGLVKILQEPADVWAHRSQAARETAERNSLERAASNFESILVEIKNSR